jgi:hypothetical protein
VAASVIHLVSLRHTTQEGELEREDLAWLPFWPREGSGIACAPRQTNGLRAAGIWDLRTNTPAPRRNQSARFVRLRNGRLIAEYYS